MRAREIGMMNQRKIEEEEEERERERERERGRCFIPEPLDPKS